MSTDYSSMTVIGFVVPVEEAFKKFIVKRPEISHMEARFDSKTGKKIAPAKVIDKDGGLALVINDEEFFLVNDDDEEDAKITIFQTVGDDEAQAIADLIKCDGFVTGDFQNGETYACFVPSKLPSDKGTYLIKDVCKFQKEIVRIGKALKKLGIDPGVGGIHIVNVVC